MKSFSTSFQKYHRWIILVVLLLLGLGVIFVFDASVAEAYQQFGDKYYFARQQLLWAGLGLMVMLFSSFIPIKFLRFVGGALFFGSLLLLLLVLIPGIGTKVQGARRWLVFGPARLQPAELMKMGMILYFSDWLSKHQKVGPFLFFMAVIFGLIMLQPDLGSALVLGSIGFGMYIAAGGPWKHIAAVAGCGVLGIVLLVLISPYRMERVKTFLSAENDPLGASYHIRQITIALGSGGWLGQGIGQSRQKYQYIPEASTDSIFAIAAEEVGFIGAGFIVSLYLSLVVLGTKIAEKVADPYARLVAIGMTIWIGSQTAINLGAVVSLIPLTGVPLPFISYGGSALILLLAGSGILIGIGRRAT
jgi:cell division protein FtsW